MPSKFAKSRKTRKPRAKAKSRRKVSAARRSTTVQRNFAVADTQIVKLKYGEKISLNAAAAGTGTYVFRANSIFDPNYTGTGHQPLSHDEWGNFYQHYAVLGSRIKVIFMPRSASVVSGSAVCSVFLAAAATSVSTAMTAIIENPKIRWGVLGGSYSKGSLRLSKGYSPYTFFGKTKVEKGDDTSAAFGANPTEEAYFHVNVTCQDDAFDPDPVDALVEIQFVVKLMERRQLVQS